MALKITKKMDNGIVVADAYAKIVSAGSSKTSTNIRVAFYVDPKQEVPFYEHEYVFKPNMTNKGKNMWKQGYEYLKTLPEFEEAEDA